MMKQGKTLSFLTVGLAFFSMFFGSGNLVFPLFLGSSSAEEWLSVAAGFVITGVIAPFLGVLMMVLYKGDTKRFFSSMGVWPALIFVTILTTVWIPLGAAPRCIQVAYEAFAHYVPWVPKWFFGIPYSLVVLWVTYNSSRMLEVLGNYLTPILLFFLGIIWLVAIKQDPSTAPVSEAFSWSQLYSGMVYGYSTMDIIATFFFASTLIHMLRDWEPNEEGVLSKAFWSGIIGMSVLAVVYLGLTYLAASNAELLQGVPKEKLLPFISNYFLGASWAVIPVGAVILACMTTSIAMNKVYVEFLQEDYLKERDPNGLISNIISLSAAYVLSLVTMDQVLEITFPALQIGCPTLVVLSFYNLLTGHYKEKEEKKSVDKSVILELSCGRD